jgi:hypothetical protein
MEAGAKVVCAKRVRVEKRGAERKVTLSGAKDVPARTRYFPPDCELEADRALVAAREMLP